MKNNKNAFLKYDEKLKIISFYLTTESHKRSNEKSKKITKVHRRAKKFWKSLDLTISNPFVGLVKKSGSHTIFPKSYIFCFQGVVLRGKKKAHPSCLHALYKNRGFENYTSNVRMGGPYRIWIEGRFWERDRRRHV